MAKIGRKPKYDEAAPIILKCIEEGMTNKDACKEAGINQDTLYRWLTEKGEFSELFNIAKKNAQKRAVKDVETALLKSAKGFDVEEVKTEYVSKLNPVTGKYEPVINKQTRTVKHFTPNVEAAKFYLTNRCPEQWKNRVEQNNTGNMENTVTIRYVGKDDEKVFPSSEVEVEL